MSFYSTDTEFYAVLKDVFDRVSSRPEHIETFTRSNLVIRMRFNEPEAEVLLDGRQPPMEVFFGPRPGDADLEMTLSADLLHRIWLGQEKLRDAFFSGRIKTQGNVFRAMKLSDLFREAENNYESVLKERGLI